MFEEIILLIFVFIHCSYVLFMFYLLLYDTCTNMTNTCKNTRYEKPWLTEGMLNACRKKINLYDEFISNKTKINEIKCMKIFK